jgi:hypothetical protein
MKLLMWKEKGSFLNPRLGGAHAPARGLRLSSALSFTDGVSRLAQESYYSFPGYYSFLVSSDYIGYVKPPGSAQAVTTDGFSGLAQESCRW